MKTGLVTSVTMHAVLLGFGIFSLSAPRAYEVADVEALPVDIVPVDSFSQVQEGDKKAPLEKPTPTPTKRPDPVENAQKVGEADTDQKTPPTPEAKPKPVERTAEPPPGPEPQPKPVEKPVEETQQAEAEDVPAPATEREPEPQPRQEVTPEPAEEPLVAENTEDESVSLPQSAPVPRARPQPPKAQTAKAPERKETEKPTAREQARSEEKDDELFDQVAALLNKEQASGGGAKRSTEEAALGGERTTAGETLTQSEEDAIRRKMEQCWQVPAGAMGLEGVRISIQFRLDPSGAVEGNPEIVSSVSSSVERAVADSARRAILRCQPYNLPAEKYNAWAEMKMNFDPTDMF
ncbi:cell envelope integrity protein TolA [Chelativorans xinjiangense]|uniref:cell envelope integrity protein TolA n=1 Tax=Chelativorans xinjiangense TaxID=2681485 RepID=UPI00135C66E8|nr:cell envelope integrity protein TolA [Chelativorans xinjiangense]